MVADAYEELWRNGSFDITYLTCLGENDRAMRRIAFLREQTAMVYNNISDIKRKEQLIERIDTLGIDFKLLQVLNSE